MATPRSNTLSDRDRRILAALVHSYIEGGEPVSSLWLAGRPGFGVSSATVRSVLARLEERGYLHQPHTSAGRVPTDLGYRAYVDQILDGRRPARPAPQVEARLRRAATVPDALEDASHEVSRASHQIGFAFAPADGAATLRHIDFVALDTRRVLVVLVTTSGEIANKVIELREDVRPVDLEQAANYLNTQFAGKALTDVRDEIEARLRQERVLYDKLVERALKLAARGFAAISPADRVFIQGASLLLEEGAAFPIETLRTLFRMIEEKHRLVRLLNECIEGTGLTIVIGREHAVPDLQPFSLVVSTYGGTTRAGMVGVIGPTRMHYARAIAAVDGVSHAITSVLVGRIS
jgi:heat-inducible transcriptional repressor